MDGMPDLDSRAAELRPRLRGHLLLPGDSAYDQARHIWNAMHDRRPAAIVQPRSRNDVVAALSFARENELAVAIRGGGHSVAGYGTVDAGLLIDNSTWRAVHVDPDRRTVRVEPGATLAALDRATQEHALAVPVGVISATGVAGLTLGGGVGWLTRPYGLTADNLIGAEVVTADGSVIRTNEDEEPDLLWGLRGGGGNFGVVTSFDLRAHPVGPEVHAGNLIYHRSKWADALHAFRGWTRDLPDELTTIINFMTPPPSWELGNETLMVIGFAWANPHGHDMLRALAPLREAVRADVEVIEPTTWLAWQSAADELFPKGQRAYWKNVALDDLPDGAIDQLLTAADAMAPRAVGIDIHHMGGAFARQPVEATAFPNRSATFWVNCYAVWESPEGDDAGRSWARDAHASLEPYATPGEYVNFLGSAPGDADATSAALTTYGEEKLARLRSLKRRFDPENVFRLNHNIDPGS